MPGQFMASSHPLAAVESIGWACSHQQKMPGMEAVSSGIAAEVSNCGVSPLGDIGPRQESRRKSDEH
jgi:hypothetical protein